MVEDEITDGTRIAQLLASELTGLSTGALAAVSVVEADPDVTPEPAGAFAYAIEYDGARVGTVSVAPDGAVVDLAVSLASARVPERAGLTVDEESSRIVVSTGAAVKPAVDVLRTALES